MKKILILSILLILMGCSGNFDQDSYFNQLVSNKEFLPFPHSEKLKYIRKHISLFEYADFLIIPAEPGKIDEIYENNIKKFINSGYQVLVQKKNSTELMNTFKIRVFVYKDSDCVIITTGNTPDYSTIVLDLSK